MSTSSAEISIKVYAPELRENDDRPMAVVHGMERAFPALSLEWTVSDDHQMVPLPQRDAWLTQARSDGGFPFVCNNDENFPVMVSGRDLPASLGPGGQALFEVHAHLPLNAAGAAAAPAVLEAVAEAARALWGRATPFEAAVDIARQTESQNTYGPPDLEPPPRGLPVIKGPSALRSPEIPGHLGWLCYWSAASARIIGFPDPARDAELLSRSRRTASGGWVVRLTDEPLDLARPAHLDALKRAYERFPEIGGRSAR